MTPAATTDVSMLLRSWRQGDPQALEKLTPLVYKELKRRARHYLRGEREGQAAETTSLVQEVFLRLVGGAEVNWQDRAHFFAVSAQMMRRILVDGARARGRAKRGGSAFRVNLEAVANLLPSKDLEVVALDDALNALDQMDPRKARVIELRFFGGLSVEETADVLGVSPQTVIRDWKLARAWLQREMRRGA